MPLTDPVTTLAGALEKQGISIEPTILAAVIHEAGLMLVPQPRAAPPPA